MSNATKCDRCGACYEYGGMTVGEEYDLCDGCIADFEAWMERGQMADASERVTNEGETIHDTGGSGYRYHIIRDGMMRMVVKGSDLKGTDVIESVEEPDTREKLEDDVREFSYQDPNIHTSEFIITHAPMDTVFGWLDRQAAITERECREYEDALREQHHKRIAELKAEIATLKEHRAANMEKLHELTDECAELRKYRDEWKGLAEKYRADSIAAQEAAAEMAQRIQTLELEITKRDKGIERLKRRRGELTEQLGAMADRMAKDGR